MAVAQQETSLPTGTWEIDRVHSTIGFEVRHMVVSTFRGRFEDYDATLSDASGELTLTGTARPASVAVKSDDLAAHLQSPDFFDSERHPELRFETASIRRQRDELVVDGELTIKGNTHPVEARGAIVGPVTDIGEAERVGIELTAVVDRTEFGLEWNAPLPSGGFALANDVKLVAALEFTKAA
jgi:polyisoprenoid-binding protein YceI